ncbi:MAG TPA: hypothetical protein VM690_01655 [Gaiellaceae bacterium]|nr:hypothetical protein [Gaiellaceae bacterium]
MEAEPRAARHLFVVLGAGASYDCVSEETRRDRTNGDLKPPLVSELFDDRFTSILNEYPRAAQIAPSVRLALRTGVVGLEDFLEDTLRLSPHQHLREAYWAIPLYLQHLFFEVSNGYTTNPDNYDRLIATTLELDRITFITLNYDTILDGRLAIQAQRAPDSMDWYIDRSRKWSLVKLHGSINWRRRVLNAPHKNRAVGGTFANDFAALDDRIELDKSLEFIGRGGIEGYRTGGELRSNLYFPALAVPIRTKTEETWCPEEQIAEIKDHQTYSYEGFNVLVIGYRAVDDDVIDLFRDSRPLRSLLVVDRNKEDALAVAARFCDSMPSWAIDRDAAAFDGNFNNFAQSSAMDEFIANV